MQGATANVSGSIAVSNGNAIIEGGSLTAGSVHAVRLAATSTVLSAGTVDVGAEGAAIEGGKLTADTVTVRGDTTLNNGLSASIGTLEANGKTVNVGLDTDTAGTTVNITNLRLDGGMLLLDPAWGTSATSATIGGVPASDADSQANASKQDVIIDGSIAVGRNSYLAIGATSVDDLVAAANRQGKGLSSSGITAIMGVYAPITVQKGNAIVVDGSKYSGEQTETTSLGDYTAAVAARNTSAGSLTFANGSLLVISKDAATDAAAITLEGKDPTVYLGDTAQIMVTGLEANQTYSLTILGTTDEDEDGKVDLQRIDSDGETAEGAVKGWSKLQSDSPFISVDGSVNEGTLTVTTTANSARDIPGMEKMDSKLMDVFDQVVANGPGSGNTKGYEFIRNLAFGTDTMPAATPGLVASTIESAARIVGQSAAPQMAMLAADAAAAGVAQRISISGPPLATQSTDGTVERATRGFANMGIALWATPIYNSQQGADVPAGHYKTAWNSDIAGIAFGADRTVESRYRVGASFHLGGGYANGTGDLASTGNNMTFWGLGAYGGIEDKNGLVAADLAYTHTSNEVEQGVPREAGVSGLKADITTHLIAAGVKAEARIPFSHADIVPHVGARHMYIYTEDYNVKTDGATVLNGKAMGQSIWTFPVGLSVSKEISARNGWYFKPSADFTVIPATGDVEGTTSVRFTGTSIWSKMDMRVIDDMAYRTTLGVEFGRGNTKFGFNYALAISDHITTHTGQGTLTVEF
jgi:hypothetical protein